MECCHVFMSFDSALFYPIVDGSNTLQLVSVLLSHVVCNVKEKTARKKLPHKLLEAIFSSQCIYSLGQRTKQV